MSEKITWTHVDRYVRDAQDSRGMLPMGLTDADCTLSYIKWLERTLEQKGRAIEQEEFKVRRLGEELERAKAPLKKSKQRITDIEQKVEFICQHLGLEI